MVPHVRPNGFELVSGDGKKKVCVRCGESQDVLEDWMGSITTFITKFSTEEVYKNVCYPQNFTHFFFQMERYNNNAPDTEKVR